MLNKYDPGQNLIAMCCWGSVYGCFIMYKNCTVCVYAIFNVKFYSIFANTF